MLVFTGYVLSITMVNMSLVAQKQPQATCKQISGCIPIQLSLQKQVVAGIVF